MRLFPLSCGRITIPATYLTPDHEAPAEVYTTTVGMFLLEHPRGLLLFDTGAAPEVVDDLRGWWGPTADGFPLHVTRDDIIDAQLRRLGYRLRDVRHVVCSHLHLDHAGGLKLFPEATVLVSVRELADAMWPAPAHRSDYILRDLLPTRGFRLVKLDGDADLFGDGSVRVLATPGHTAGHLSLRLELPDTGPVLLPGDACMCALSLAGRLAPGSPLPCAEAVWRGSLERIAGEVAAGALPLWSHQPIDALGGTGLELTCLS